MFTPQLKLVSVTNYKFSKRRRARDCRSQKKVEAGRFKFAPMFAKVEKKVSDQEKTNKLCRYVKQKIGASTFFLGRQFAQD